MPWGLGATAFYTSHPLTTTYDSPPLLTMLTYALEYE
jgi:hypothetical protein